MKVKYFIRGLGLGILITALILGISYKAKYSDEDVILRAKKLGMVFSEDISGSAIDADAQKTEEPVVTPDITEEPEPAATVKPTKQPEEKQTDEPDSTQEPATASATDSDQVSFSIEKGDLGSVVSEKLESLGVIEDAGEFNKYLGKHGYSVRIKIGDYTLKKGASFDEIAKMITR